MSDEKIDVLAVMDGLCEVADEHQDEGPSGCGYASDKLSKLRADGPEARAAVAELIEAARAATAMVMHDGTSSREACDRLDAAWRACVAANG